MAEPTHVLGIDIGTGGCRTLVIGLSDGKVTAAADASYPLSTPAPGWSEQDPADWWQACCQSIASAMQRANIEPSHIACVGLTGQMHGLVVLDKHHEVLRPAMLWNDGRTEAECADMDQRIGRERLIQITGKPALTSFTAPKLLWLRAHEPAVWSRITQVMLPKDEIRRRLTGVCAIDVTDASGTSMLDVSTRNWSHEVLTHLDLDPSWFPDVHESPTVVGAITPNAAKQTGLMAGIPVVAGAGDQAAAGLACGIADDSVISVNLGTSGVIFAACQDAPIDVSGSMHTFCHAVPHTCHLMGCMLSAGGSLQWYRNTFCPDLDYDTIINEATSVDMGCEGLSFAPYLTGERTPHQDASLTGAFHGITNRHSRAHFSRAVLEGILHGLLDSIDLVQQIGRQPTHVRMTGGGARSATWRRMAADIFGLPVTTVNVTDGSAYGAGMLAMVAAGRYPDVSDCMTNIIEETSSIDPQNHDVDRHTAWMQAAHPRKD